MRNQQLLHTTAFAGLLVLLALTLVGCPQNPFFGLVPSPRDEEGPEITIINPTDGQAVSGTLVVTGIATDKYRVAKVSVRVGQGDPVPAEGTNTWYHAIDTTGLGEGSHTVTVIAVDQWNNVSEKSATIVVDQSVPEVTIPYNPAQFENYFSGTNLTLSGIANDDNEVVRVQISLDGGVSWTDTELAGSGGSRTWSYTIADTAAVIPGDGSTTMVLRVHDDAGLIGSAALLVYFDNAPPAVTIGVPAHDVTIDSSEDLENDMLVVSGTASDNMVAGVGSIVINLRKFGAAFASETITNGASEGISSYSRAFDLTSIGPVESSDVRNYGPITIEVVAVDRAGNSAATTVTASLDDDPPKFGGVFTLDGAGNLDGDLAKPINNIPTGTHVIAGTVTTLPAEVETVEVMAGTSANSGSVFGYELIDNPDDVTLDDGAVDGAGNWSYSLDTSRFTSDGVYFLTFRVTNSRGGFDRVYKRIRIDRQSPTVVILSPQEGSKVSGSNVSVSGSASGNGSPLQLIGLRITDDVNGTPTVLVGTTFSYVDGFAAPDPDGVGSPYHVDGFAELAYWSGGFAWTWDTSAFTPDSDIEIEITATDMAGNTSSDTIVVMQDPDAPIARFSTYDHPTNPDHQAQPLIPGRFINGSGTIRGEAEATAGIDSVQISLNNLDWLPADISALPAWEYELPGLDSGTQTLYLLVTDGASSTNTMSITVEVDNTQPNLGELTVELLDGSGTSYYHGTVLVSGTATDSGSDIASVVVTVDGDPAPGVVGTHSFSLEWDTQTLPSVTRDGVVVEAIATDLAGNRATVQPQGPVNVRPYISSLNRTRAYLGEEELVISGNNLGSAGDPPDVTVGGGDVTVTAIDAGASPNTVTFTVPGDFPPIDANLSSGPVIVTYGGVSNAAQQSVKMDLFHRETVTALDDPRYPNAAYHPSADRLIYAFMGSNGNRRRAYFRNDDVADTEVFDDGGGNLSFPRVAAEDASNRVYVTYSYRDDLFVDRSDNDFGAKVSYLLSGSATHNDIAVSTDNTVHIVYYENGSLYYRRSADRMATIDDAVRIDGESSDTGEWVALAVDSSNRPHVVYHDATANSLRYSYRTAGGTWAPPRAVDGNAAGSFGNGIAIDGTGGIHVSYYNGNSGNLMYARATGPTGPFATQIVDATGITGWFSSIAVDSANRPHITYASFSVLKPRYARMTDAGFVAITIADEGTYEINNNSNTTSTVIDGNIDGNGNVYMIYTTDDGLRRAVYLPEN